MKQTAAFFALAATLIAAAPALAASDYFLKIEGIKGEAAAAPVAVDSWSFGVCNVGQCAAAAREASTGQPSEKTGGSGNATWNLATNKGGRMAGGGGGSGGTVGDLDGDGSPDLAFTAGQDTVYGLSFTVDAAAPGIAAACASGKIGAATLTNGTETFAVSSVSVVCKGGAGGGAAAASYARSGITRIDSTPARISTNMTVGKQTQGATFGEKVNQGMASAGSMVTMTLTGGQMKHTKSGHVTLLK